ncbi:MAG: sigma-70 family RNA polymerase sigma factor [Xanthomonadales bacterium]|nr:sigma-70 family RNA polymerase sigma factor [Xanthomonadales bacterium]
MEDSIGTTARPAFRPSPDFLPDPDWRLEHWPVTSGIDEALMLAYAAGDATAFDRLYESYRGPLYRFILRQVKDPVSSNDLYQQCWEKLIKGRQSYRGKSPFAAWLFRIARNTVVDHYRRQPNRPERELPELASEAAGPESSALQDETADCLAAAIDALPGEQREVVLLRLEAGLDLAAIADLTGVNMETCKSRLRYALAKLKQQMQVNPEPEGGHHVPR